jgi:histidine triad (HIT) family protein
MRVDANCIFCKIVAGEIPCFSLWEDSETLAFMDINPANRGHALVIPKEHWEDVYTIPDVAIGTVGATAQRIAKAALTALTPDGINLVQANGPGAAQSVFHFHMHVLPRYSGDELKINWSLKPGDMDEIKMISELIKVELANV